MMKKLIAVIASCAIAVMPLTVSAACVREQKISVSDIIDCVKSNNAEDLLNKIVSSSDCPAAKVAGFIGNNCFSGSGKANTSGVTYDDIINELISSISRGGSLSLNELIKIPGFSDVETIIPDAPAYEPSEEEPAELPEQKPEEKPEEPEIIVPEQQKPAEQQPAQPEQKPSENTAANQSSNSSVNEVLRLVNQYRNQSGLASVALDSALCNAADIRAKETKSLFSHTRPDGRSCFTVLSDLGISYRGAGENIAYGQRSASEVMTAWMNSEGHRANIMNPSFTKLGVGVFTSGGTIYWSQMFTY